MNAQIVTSRTDGVEYMKGKRTIFWGCGKNIEKGNKLFIYFRQPHKEIRFVGTAMQKAKPSSRGGYCTKIKIRKLRAPIAFGEMQEMFPKWKWLNYPRQQPYLNGENARIARALWKRAELKLDTAPVLVKVSGAGFGNPEQNRIVEQAACKAVRLYYEKRGYEIISREKENLGYDFDVRRAGEELHVEVKGISGSDLRFPITANEIARARSDSKFRLTVVTKAVSGQRQIHAFSRKDFLKHFDFKPFAFFAEAKSSLFP